MICKVDFYIEKYYNILILGYYDEIGAHQIKTQICLN